MQAGEWILFAHPCFLDQVESLVESVEFEMERRPDRYKETADFKVLSAIACLAFDLIPQQPDREEYRQGGTLGRKRRHWFRAKFGGGRFRLFFRFRTDAKILVYAWVNDQDTLLTYGSRTDAYSVFARMLDAGYPPEDWDELLDQAQSTEAARRTESITRRIRSATGAGSAGRKRPRRGDTG